MSGRELLIVGAASAATMPTSAEAAESTSSALRSQAPTSAGLPASKSDLRVDGEAVALELDNRTTLLDAPRERLFISSTEKGCDHGQCGACTVIVDGRRINDCFTLAVMHEGGSVTTIEGSGTPERLHPMRAAIAEHDGDQYGHFTLGQTCSAVAALDAVKVGMPSHVNADLAARPLLSAEELREQMSGNICRCGAWSNLIEAMTEVAGRPAWSPSPSSARQRLPPPHRLRRVSRAPASSPVAPTCST